MYCSPENRRHNYHRHHDRDGDNGDDDVDREDGDDDDDGGDDVPETLDAFKGISFHPPVKTGQVVSHPVRLLL